MANIIVGFNNLADNSTLSGGSWVATLPLNNLKDRRLYKLARSTNANLSSTKFDVDLVGNKTVKVFGLVGHNISPDATARLSASDTASFTTTVYDSGFVSVWPVSDSLTLDWEDENFWFGTPTTEQIGMFSGLGLWVPPSITARYWRVEINDTLNVDGYVEIGRLFVSKDFTPSTNASYGLNFGVIDKSEIEESLSGVEHYNEKRTKRSVDFLLPILSENEAFGRWFRLMLGQGRTGEVLFIYNHEDERYSVDRSFLGRVETINPLSSPFFDNWTSGATIVEVT